MAFLLVQRDGQGNVVNSEPVVEGEQVISFGGVAVPFLVTGEQVTLFLNEASGDVLMQGAILGVDVESPTSRRLVNVTVEPKKGESAIKLYGTGDIENHTLAIEREKVAPKRSGRGPEKG